MQTQVAQQAIDEFLSMPEGAADQTSLKRLDKLMSVVGADTIPSLCPLLPLALSIRGEPYTLDHHFVMEPIFKTTLPWKGVWKCGRQVSKSTSLAAQGVVLSSVTPFLRTLYVLPLYEMTRRFSGNYVKPLIQDSPIRPLFVDTTCDQNVLQRGFINQAQMFFSYAFTNCDRVRGISADYLVIDECQDMDWDFIPIIAETLSASKWGIHQYSGTPKTFDNTLQVLWEDSSQGEWMIPCQHCKHWNIPAIEFDLMAMIGPVSNIHEYGTALVCAKCGKWIDAEAGMWVHRHPDRMVQFVGHHVPQVVMPMHYADEKKWTELLQKKNKAHPAVFLNEVLGESCDVGLKLVTLEELKAASVLHKLDFHVARKTPFDRYTQRILGVDWGGGGEAEISYTTLAVIGMRPSGRFELIWGERLHATTSDVEEVRRILEVRQLFQCSYIAHDFAGAGAVHETLLLQAQFDIRQLLPFVYVASTAKNMITATAKHKERTYLSIDKARSLLLLCTMIKTQYLLLTEYESSKALTDDFLHLKKETKETQQRGEILTIQRQPKLSDDFAHACNFAIAGHMWKTGHYPDFSKSFGLTITPEQKIVAEPTIPDFEGF